MAKRYTLCAALLLFTAMRVLAQPLLKTTVSKNDILIGEQFSLKVEAMLPKEDFFVKWISLPDSLEHFEVIDRSKIDSSFTGQKLTRLSQTFTFTSFDSGKWTVPAMPVTVTPASSDSGYALATDSFSISVGYQRDSTDVIRDIKTIREVQEEFNWWLWGSIAAATILILLLVIWWYRRRKRRPEAVFTAGSVSAYQAALKELAEIKSLSLSEPASVKIYHSRLSDVLRRYLSVKQGVNYFNSTTGDMLVQLKQRGFTNEMTADAAAVLRLNDAVKFARYLPALPESENSWNIIRTLIESTEHQPNT